MPIYEYHCQDCGRNARLRFSYEEYDHVSPPCPYCGSEQFQRRIGRVAISRSEELRLDTLMDDDSLAGLENDPRAMGQFMRQMSREMGEDMDEEMEEVAGRLEKGESLESIERSLPGPPDMDGMGGDVFQ